MLKAVDEYKKADLEEALEHACQMSIAVISGVWHDCKDMERPDNEDIHAVKKAMQILCIHEDMKQKYLTQAR